MSTQKKSTELDLVPAFERNDEPALSRKDTEKRLEAPLPQVVFRALPTMSEAREWLSLGMSLWAGQPLQWTCLQPGETPAAAESGKFDPIKELDSAPPRELWKRYFSEERSSDEIRKVVQRLHSRKQYKHVIAALRAALLAGQPEPWMYEVLALTMDIEGYPKNEVERVMLSMTDFNARDVENLLGSAAYLVRLGAPAQALKLYQQVSSLQPSRPEPYLLGLRLADELKDVEALSWAATGVLTWYWFDDYEAKQREAVKLMRDWQLRLQQAGKTEQAAELANALAKAQVRDLQLRLEWSGEADLDLIVQEPLGTTCSFADRYTQSGGALLHEGAGPKQAECFEEYVCAYAASGHYVITIDHVAGRLVGNRARLQVIRYAGTPDEQRDSVNVVFNERQKKYRISLHDGRRTQKTEVFEPEAEPTTTQKRREALKTLADLRRQMAFQQPGLNQLRPQVTGAVGYSPVVQNVSSGVNLTAQATVSPDRRYVRLGLQPSISEVTDVFTFTFAGGR